MASPNPNALSPLGQHPKSASFPPVAPTLPGGVGVGGHPRMIQHHHGPPPHGPGPGPGMGVVGPTSDGLIRMLLQSATPNPPPPPSSSSSALNVSPTPPSTLSPIVPPLSLAKPALRFPSTSSPSIKVLTPPPPAPAPPPPPLPPGGHHFHHHHKSRSLDSPSMMADHSVSLTEENGTNNFLQQLSGSVRTTRSRTLRQN